MPVSVIVNVHVILRVWVSVHTSQVWVSVLEQASVSVLKWMSVCVSLWLNVNVVSVNFIISVSVIVNVSVYTSVGLCDCGF